MLDNMDSKMTNTNKKFNRKLLMNLNIKVLRFVGLWRDFPSKHSKWSENLYYIYGWFISFLLITHVTTQLLDIIFTWGNLQNLAGNGCLALTYAAAVTKHIIFLLQHKRIFGLVQELQIGFLSTSLTWNNAQEEILQRTHYHTRIVSWIYYSFGIIDISLFDVLPILKSFPNTFGLSSIVQNNQTLKSVLYKAWFPFDIQEARYYIMAYVFQVMNSTFGPTTNIGIDTFIVSLIICYCGHFKILKISLIKICDRTEYILSKMSMIQGDPENKIFFKSSLNERTRPEIEPAISKQRRDPCLKEKVEYQCLIECICHHQKLLMLVAKIEQTLNFCLFIQFLSSSCAICLVAFYIAINIDSVGVIGILDYIQFLAISFLQLLLFCWYGEHLIYESDSLTKAMYDSPWYEASIKYRKSLCIMMSRTITLSRLTGGKLYMLSLETFRAILGASFSYYTVLRNLNNI